MNTEMFRVAEQGRMKCGLKGFPPGIGNPVDYPASHPFVTDQPAVAENLEMVGDSGLLHL